MFWAQDFLIRCGFEPVENWRSQQKVCFICKEYWCVCLHQHTLDSIADASTPYLQELVRDCFECGVLPTETPLVEAVAKELAHRTRYNLDPRKRWTGECHTSLDDTLKHYNHGVPVVEEQ